MSAWRAQNLQGFPGEFEEFQLLPCSIRYLLLKYSFNPTIPGGWPLVAAFRFVDYQRAGAIPYPCRIQTIQLEIMEWTPFHVRHGSCTFPPYQLGIEQAVP
jgi:hypothetical protein